MNKFSLNSYDVKNRVNKAVLETKSSSGALLWLWHFHKMKSEHFIEIRSHYVIHKNKNR